jgi:hypothetical protein
MTAIRTSIRTIIVTTRALSYDEIAHELGIEVASARRLVHRKRWAKTRGNDGHAIVQVPAEFFERRDRPSDRPDDEPNDRHNDSPSDSPISDVLTRLAAAQGELVEMARRLGVAEGELEVLRPERERAERLAAEAAAVPALRDTVAALKAALESERGRVGELRAERDRLAARRAWWPWRRAG